MATITFQGTRRRQYESHENFTYKRVQSYHVLESGYGARSKKHAGVLIALKTARVQEHQIVDVHTPADPSLRGRAIAIRIKQGTTADITIVNMYFPPAQLDPGKTKAQTSCTNGPRNMWISFR